MVNILFTNDNDILTGNVAKTIYDQTTPNMIQRLNGIFEIKPLISRVF